MTFDEATREAALAANGAANESMRLYKAGRVHDEDDLTGVLVGQLHATLRGQIGGLKWDAQVVRHRAGVASEEKRIGADLVIHVQMDTPTQRYSKGVLVQAKRIESDEWMYPAEHRRLIAQCNKMLAITPAAFVFSYARNSMRCGSATRISGSTRVDIYNLCGWTSYRFFFELFRCPIGDVKISSAAVADLPAPIVLSLRATGELTEEGSPLS